MPEDQTDTMVKPPVDGSSLFKISIRGWLVLLTTVCVLLNWTANTVMVSLGYTSANINVPEPIYSVWIGMVGIYYGQQIKR